MCSNSPLEKHIEGIINMFHQYSVRVDHWDMLSKGELKKLIEEQLPTYMKSQKNPKAVEQLLAELDKDKNNQLSFEEFMPFMVKMAIFCHDKIHEKEHHHHQGQQHGHDHGHKQ